MAVEVVITTVLRCINECAAVAHTDFASSVRARNRCVDANLDWLSQRCAGTWRLRSGAQPSRNPPIARIRPFSSYAARSRNGTRQRYPGFSHSLTIIKCATVALSAKSVPASLLRQQGPQPCAK